MDSNSEDTKNKLTFELKDLSYEDLLSSYNEILDFIKYLSGLKLAIGTDMVNDKKEGGDKK